jgi:preprotein translocase subunit YajC
VDNVLSILPLVGIAVLFWLILIRPAQRRQRALVRTQGAVAIGDEVMLTSGIYGTVREVHDDSISLEVSAGVTLRVIRAAVGSVETRAGSGPDEQTELTGYRADEPEETQ